MGSQVQPEIAALIVRLRRDIGLSYRGICAHLDRKGIRPLHAVTWAPMTVRNVYLRVTRDRHSA